MLKNALLFFVLSWTLVLTGCLAPTPTTLPPEPPAAGGPRPAGSVAGASWSRALTNVVWSNRDSHGTLVHDGKLWVIGGWHTGSLADVWVSEDGRNWRELVSQAPWPARKAHAAVVFHGEMWILGGTHGVGQLADVWSSADGIRWRLVAADATWGERNDHAAVVFRDRLWVLGGWQGANRNDVWSSADGAVWTRVTAAAPWSGRNNLAAAVWDDKIWVTGGWGERPEGGEGNLDDVWWSADGADWQLAAEHAPWAPRNNHTLTVWDGRLWLIGGWADRGAEEGNLADVWSTADGITWRPVTMQATWLPRNAHGTVVFDHRLWVIGGWSQYIGGTSVNDLWFAAPRGPGPPGS